MELKIIFLFALVSLFLVGLVNAGLGFDNPNLPRLKTVTATSSSSGNCTCDLTGYVPYEGATSILNLALTGQPLYVQDISSRSLTDLSIGTSTGNYSFYSTYGSAERLKLDIGTTSNQAKLSSSTGIHTFDFGSILIKANGSSRFNNIYLYSNDNIQTPQNVTASYFFGDGSGLTNLPASTESDPLWTANKSLVCFYSFDGNNFNGTGNFTTTGQGVFEGMTLGYLENEDFAHNRYTALNSFIVPRAANWEILFGDYLDELYYAQERGFNITSSVAISAGSLASMFYDDSNTAQWNTGVSLNPLVLTINMSSSPITAKSSGYYKVGFTFRASNVNSNPTHIKIETYNSTGGSYITVVDEDYSSTSNLDWYVSPRFLSYDTSSRMSGLRITMNFTDPLPNTFRIQRLMLYHATASWDPWHLSTGGGTVYGDITTNGNVSSYNFVTNGTTTTSNAVISGNLSVKVPFLYATDNTTQNFVSTASTQAISFSVTEESHQISIENKQNVTFQKSGNYYFSVRPYLYLTSGSNIPTMFWMEHWNGTGWTQIQRSNTRFFVTNNSIEQYLNLFYQREVSTSEKVRFMWWANSTNMQLFYTGTYSTPTRPSVSSASLSVNKLAEVV